MYYSYYIYIMFFPMMFISSMLSLLMNSWFSLWMIMEINMISIIMLMIFDKMMNYELLMKYFLFQSFNSYIYLLNSYFLMIENFINSSLIIMNLNMLSKISIIPFHFWYLKILYNMNWMNIFIMTTLNKIIPIFILNNIINKFNFNIMIFNFTFLIISSFIGSLMGMNQINMKLIMGYSSMVQISWILILMMFNELFSLIYFVIYIFISLNLNYMFYIMNLNNLMQLNSMKFYNFKMMLLMMMLMFSLSGIPPLMGFLMKWIHIENMMYMNLSFYFMMMMIINSLISMYFYFRIMFLNLMNYYFINKMNFKFNKFNINYNFKLIILNWLNLFLIISYEII